MTATSPSDFGGIPIVEVPANARTPLEVVQFLVKWLVDAGQVPADQLERLVQQTIKRESLGSTGIGGGFAFPHATSEAIEKLAVVMGRLATPVDWSAIDGHPVLFVALVILKGPDRLSSLRELEAIVQKIRERNV